MARAGYDPSAAVRLQETFVKLSEGKDESWLAGLLSTHPPSRERVEANRAMLAQLPAGGETGVKRYREKMARLMRTKPAYEAYEKGIKALKEGRTYEAIQKADEAISIEPREALFYILKGDALDKMGRPYEALNAYEHARRLNPNYYYPHQQKGILLYRLGNWWEAKRALETGTRFLKTAPAIYTLGRIARSEGRYEDARKLFKTATESDSDTGRMAWRDLLKMDLPYRAGDYLSAELKAGKNGELILEVINHTPLTMKDVAVYLETPAKKGNVTMPGQIRGGERSVIKSKPSGLKPEQVKGFSARVVSAYLAE